jgi:hypothetical protein
MGIFKFLYFPTLSVFCEERDGSTYLLCFSVFFTSGDGKKERTAGRKEGEKRQKLCTKQINILFFSFDGVGLCVLRVLIL